MTEIERLVVTKQLELLNYILEQYLSSDATLFTCIKNEKVNLELKLKNDEDITHDLRYDKR